MGNEELRLKLKDLAVFLNEEASGSSRRFSETDCEWKALTELYKLFPNLKGKLDDIVYVSGIKIFR